MRILMVGGSMVLVQAALAAAERQRAASESGCGAGVVLLREPAEDSEVRIGDGEKGPVLDLAEHGPVKMNRAMRRAQASGARKQGQGNRQIVLHDPNARHGK